MFLCFVNEGKSISIQPDSSLIKPPEDYDSVRNAKSDHLIVYMQDK